MGTFKGKASEAVGQGEHGKLYKRLKLFSANKLFASLPVVSLLYLQGECELTRFVRRTRHVCIHMSKLGLSL